MKVIVITGSTRGIGYGLAHEFLARGHAVVVSGRSSSSVASATGKLGAQHPAERLLGQPCDVGDYAQVQALWEAAVVRFGRVDIWINNAGLSNPMHMLWEQQPAIMEQIVKTNLLGVMNGSYVAMRGMVAQGSGTLYNMEGFGSDGGFRAGLLLYGSTKYAVRYFTKGLLKEAKGLPVHVNRLSPGIVITDLLMDGYVGRDSDKARAKRIFNILGDTVETVTPYLVERILANTQNGAYINWLTTGKILSRFLTAGFSKRDLFSAEG